MEELIGKVFDEFPTESDWDAVIVGAGPNGLMTAAYLASARLTRATPRMLRTRVGKGINCRGDTRVAPPGAGGQDFR
ncbi:MAG: hypothetical protein ISS53_03225 [Dehalococcoidia bacterium]|nr:hypothetical protein [Dehalococcoidia bacterium]